MEDKANVEGRLERAYDLRDSLNAKFEKVKGSPREEEFRLQIQKVDELIAHLEDELNE